MHIDSEQYLNKKRQLKKILTIFGRNPVLEVLQNPSLQVFRLHLAESNKANADIELMRSLAANRDIEICYHTKQALSRISKNAKQDQGVALDVQCNSLLSVDEFFADLPSSFELIALDSVTNPQNLGMIIRSVCASPITALLLPEKGCAKLDALVIKASAGTLFKAPILRCGDLAATLKQFRQGQTDIYAMDVRATQSLQGFKPGQRSIYVLGNESEGLSKDVSATCSAALRIPMANGVESLNVSITAALLAFRSSLI